MDTMNLLREVNDTISQYTGYDHVYWEYIDNAKLIPKDLILSALWFDHVVFEEDDPNDTKAFQRILSVLPRFTTDVYIRDVFKVLRGK